MGTEIFKLLIAVLAAVYFMLPAYVANLSGLAFGGGTPVDGGKECKDGRRLIGNGVTWKGLQNGTIIGTLVGVVLGIIGTFYGSVFGGLILGFLMAFGALLGDAVGSFLKRRIGLERGAPAPIMDQLDFVIGALVLSLLVVQISWEFFIIIALLSLVLHLGSNTFAYLIGIKDVWY